MREVCHSRISDDHQKINGFWRLSLLPFHFSCDGILTLMSARHRRRLAQPPTAQSRPARVWASLASRAVAIGRTLEACLPSYWTNGRSVGHAGMPAWGPGTESGDA